MELKQAFSVTVQGMVAKEQMHPGWLQMPHNEKVPHRYNPVRKTQSGALLSCSTAKHVGLILYLSSKKVQGLGADARVQLFVQLLPVRSLVIVVTSCYWYLSFQ